MSWKPLKIGLPPREGRSQSPKKPTTLQPLRTSHEVKKAHQRRQNTVATPAGVFTFERGRPPLAHPPVATTSHRDASATISHLTPQLPSSSQPRSSSSPRLPTLEPGWSNSFSDPYAPPTPTTVVKASRSQKQWVKWTTDVIPSLLKPYLSLMHMSDSLRNLFHDQEIACICGRTQRRVLTVTCLYFDGMFSFLVFWFIL